MKPTENIKKIREELQRFIGSFYIQPAAALTAVMRRKGAGDYRISIDDAALLSALGTLIRRVEEGNALLTDIKGILQNVDSDTDNLAHITTNTANTKTAVDQTRASVNTVNTSVNAVRTAVDQTKAAVSTVGEKVDAVKATADNIAGYTDGVEAGQLGIMNKLDKVIENTKKDNAA